MEDGAAQETGLIVLLVFLILHVLCYGFDSALQNSNAGSLEKPEMEGDKRVTVLRLFLKNPARSVHSLQFFAAGMQLAAGTYAIASYTGTKRILILVSYWMLLLAAGMYAPAKIAGRKAKAWSVGLCRLMLLPAAIGYPFVRLLEFASDLLVRLFGVDPNEDPDDLTEEEIISMVNDGHKQGVLLASEAEMIHNIFEFGDKEAKDIMTHRKNIVALDGTKTFAEAMDFLNENGYSRFPVYLDDIDNIVGVLHIKEALRVSAGQKYYEKQIKDIRDLVRKIDFIPETRNINTLFKEMQSEKTHMVIVVDEYGQTAGIVAMEDILEEIVGNILDEHDEDDGMIRRQSDGSYLMQGMAQFEDVTKELSIEVPEEQMHETLNGFLVSKIDKIPDDNDRMEVHANGWCFKILAVGDKTIKKVSVSKITEHQDDAGEDSSCQKPEIMVE